MKEAVAHSKITFENMLKQWHNLTDKQRQEIQSNIDYLNEQLTMPAVVRQSEQLVCPDCAEGRDPFEPEWKCPECRRKDEAN